MPASTYPHLLPPNATVLERGLAGALGRITAIGTPIDKTFRWDEAPAALLPWLAWALSVDLWDKDWSELRQRNMIRESFALHRKKGTLWAIGRSLEYVDAELLRAIVPPDITFAGKAMTTDEITNWLSRFAQLRVYQFRQRGAATFGAFGRGAWHLGKTFPGSYQPERRISGPGSLYWFLPTWRSNTADTVLAGQAGKPTFFPYQTNAAERYGRRAFLWDKGPHHLASGLETPQRWILRENISRTGVATTYEQALIAGNGIWAMFAGATVKGNLNRKNGRLFPVAGTAGNRIVSVAIQRDYRSEADMLLLRSAIGSGLEPVKVFPERVAEKGTSKRGINIFAGMAERWLDPETGERKWIKCFLLGYVPETTAPLRLYDRLYLYDPARIPERRKATMFAGYTRLGMPPFQMQLDVKVQGKRSRWAFDDFVHGFSIRSSTVPLERARMAIIIAKSARDKVLMRTALHRPLTSADGRTTAGGYRTGALITS